MQAFCKIMIFIIVVTNKLAKMRLYNKINHLQQIKTKKICKKKYNVKFFLKKNIFVVCKLLIFIIITNNKKKLKKI